MANQYLNQFAAKTTPVGADILYLGDSANTFVEAKTTITQIISNNSIVVKSAATSGNLPIWSSSTQIGDSGISVDGSRNITNVANLTATNVDATIGANTPTTGKFTTVTSTSLTSGQMIYATTGGRLQNSGIAVDTSQNLTSVGSITGSGTGQFAALKATGLSSGQVVVAGASGALTGSSAFTLSGNLLSVTASSGIAANVASPKATYHFATGSTILSGTSAITIGNLANNEINPYISNTDLAFNYKTNAGAFYTVQFSNYLLKAANLSDVANQTTAFDNISPLLIKGDLIAFNGTNNVRVPVGSNGYTIVADSTQPAGIKWTAISADLPLTTKGDLLTYDGSSDVRLGVGSNDYVLTADSSQPYGLKWAPIPAQGDNILIITGTTTLTSANYGQTIICQASSSAYTVTLPLVTTGTNKFLYFVFDAHSVAQTFITIATQGGASIIGPGSSVQYGTGESVTLMSNGSSWFIVDECLVNCDMKLQLAGGQAAAVGNRAVVWDTVVYQNNINYNNSTGVITPTYPGTYELTGTVCGANSASLYTQAAGWNVSSITGGASTSINSTVPATTVGSNALITDTYYFDGVSKNVYFSYATSASIAIPSSTQYANFMTIKRIRNY